MKRHKYKSFTLNILSKYLLSFFKSDWVFDDYPLLTVYEQRQFTSGKQWYANLENWNGMIVNGKTKEEAIQRLKDYFIRYKCASKKLPRPGTKVRIKIASSQEIYKYKDIQTEFLNNILTKDIFGTTLIVTSDLSTLQGYCGFSLIGKDNFKYEVIKRTKQRYGIDISDLFDGPLYKIFERIKEKTNRVS